jgi:hypothetical protein
MAGWWFSLCTPVWSTNKTDCHDITKILLKVALSTITLFIGIFEIASLIHYIYGVLLKTCHMEKCLKNN